MRNRWLAIGALNGLLAVAAGAFGAHGLKDKLSAELLDPFRTAAQYHLAHSLILCVSAIAPLAGKPGRCARLSFLAGIILFCGSLYAYALSGFRELALITPVGGLAFMAGWAALAWAGLAGPRRENAA